MVPGVSDEVWAQLDPYAGQLSRRTVMLGRIMIVAAALLVVAGGLVWRTGIVVPRLAWPDGLPQWQEMPTGARVWVTVANEGRFPVTVLDVGRSAPGFELLGVEGPDRASSPFPVTLRPGQGVDAVLVYRITDCNGPPVGDWPLTALVDRPWGTMTVEVPVPDGGHGVQLWRDHVVSTWCRPGGPGG
ncbi:MAG: hypothetical protein IRY85_08350 [Micromonosporaceae bacterium]|nr:hypothetical protein [Micromonosporaceae bacterium]